MIPSIFVSSTISDLHHLRDAVRETLVDLGYTPVMSEYGDIGYSPADSVENSCYVSIGDCQLAIIIVGKRYGSVGNGGLSVTHNEFRAAREKKLPIIALVDREVETFRRVHESNSTKAFAVEYPGMEKAESVFGFIKEIADSPKNNGILPYASVADARSHLKRQLAHLFGDLLRSEFDPLRAEVKDVLSEIKALRHDLSSSTNKSDDADSRAFLRATRFLLEDDNKLYGQVLERMCKDIGKAIQLHLSATSFDDLAAKADFAIVVDADFGVSSDFRPTWKELQISWMQTGWIGRSFTGSSDRYNIAGLEDGRLLVNEPGKRMLDDYFTRLKRAIE